MEIDVGDVQIQDREGRWLDFQGTLNLCVAQSPDRSAQRGDREAGRR